MEEIRTRDFRNVEQLSGNSMEDGLSLAVELNPELLFEVLTDLTLFFFRLCLALGEDEVRSRKTPGTWGSLYFSFPKTP